MKNHQSLMPAAANMSEMGIPGRLFQGRVLFLLWAFGLILFCLHGSAQASPASRLDFDADGKEDVLLWEVSSGEFLYTNGARLNGISTPCSAVTSVPLVANLKSALVAQPIVWIENGSVNPARFVSCANDKAELIIELGQAGDIPISDADFDGDGISDLSVYRPSNSRWYRAMSSLNGAVREITFGSLGDIPVTGDFNGDGKDEVGVYTPKLGRWSLLQSDEQTVIIKQFGLAIDVPVPGDFDGDGVADLAVWRAETGVWHVKCSRDGKYRQTKLGLPNDVPLALDITGNGSSDFVVFRRETGEVFYKTKFKDQVKSLIVTAQQMEAANRTRVYDVSEDFNGDGRSDFVTVAKVNRALRWTVTSLDGVVLLEQKWGKDKDVPFLGDFDGDGITDRAIVRSAGGVLTLYYSSTANLENSGSFNLGSERGQLLGGNLDGDKRTDLAFVREGDKGDLQWTVIISDVSAPVKVKTISWGQKGDIPMLGDIDGDGLDDLVVVRSLNKFFYWYPRSISDKSAPGLIPGVQWGINTDVPVLADLNADNIAEITVLRRKGNFLYWYILEGNKNKPRIVQWGLKGDRPFTGHFSGTPLTELAVWRRANTSQVYVNAHYKSPMVMPLGSKTDKLVTERDVLRLTKPLAPPVVAPVTQPVVVLTDTNTTEPSVIQPLNTTPLKCDFQLPTNDGAGGFTYLPSSSNGKMAVIVPARFKGIFQSGRVFKDGKLLEALQAGGNFSDGRPIYRGAKVGSAYPQGIAIQFLTIGGQSYCATISNPGQSVE